jgi:hypothetical protein
VATIQPQYGNNNQAFTITLNSHTTATTQGSTAIQNTPLYEDALVFIEITTAASGVSATGYINVYGYGSVDGGSTYTESFGGTNGTVTLASPPNAVLIAQINANANATTYRAGPFSFCRQYGLDRLPQYWGIFVTNATGATLAATTNSAYYQGVNGLL